MDYIKIGCSCSSMPEVSKHLKIPSKSTVVA